MSDRPWELRVAAPAPRQLDRLPISVVAAVIETLGAIAANPRRLGKPLRFELKGQRSARRGPYRIVYRIDEGLPNGLHASDLVLARDLVETQPCPITSSLLVS